MSIPVLEQPTEEKLVTVRGVSFEQFKRQFPRIGIEQT